MLSEKSKRIIFYFGLFGLGLFLFAYLRNKFDFLPSNELDTIIWFLASPSVCFQFAFNFPEIIMPLILIAQYCLTGYFFAAVVLKLKFPNKKLVIVIAICQLLIIHYICTLISMRQFGKVLENSLKGIFKTQDVYENTK